MEQQNTVTFERRRRFLTVLPLIVLPFLVLFFWAIGGGKGKGRGAGEPVADGINTTLPSPSINENRPTDKMSLYEQALKDSLHREKEREYDFKFWEDGDASEPQMSLDLGEQDSVKPSSSKTRSNPVKRRRGTQSAKYIDPNEARVSAKLAQLEKELNSAPRSIPGLDTPVMDRQDATGSSREVERLREMMQHMQAPADEDTELQQLQSMLDKILDIQHPQRMHQKIQEQSALEQGRVFAVSSEPQTVEIDLLQPARPQPLHLDTALSDTVMLPHIQIAAPAAAQMQNTFFELDDEPARRGGPANVVAAVIHETQELVTGATVKMRLEQDIFVAGALIPKGSFLFGNCSLNGERLQIGVKNIHAEGALYPVNLEVYDLDGIAGVRVPGAITRDAAKQGMGQAIQSAELLSMDPSLGAQAATAGMQAVKSLLGKKAKLIKVTLTANHPILLRDANEKG